MGCPAVALDLQFHPLHVRPDASALIVYVTLALSAVWQRRLLKLLTAEAVQGIRRFTVPLLPAEQLTNTRVATAFCGGDLGHYGSLPTAFWYGRPINGILQIALQTGRLDALCIGLRFWMRLCPRSDTAQPSICPTACIERPCVSTGRAASCT